MSQEPRGGEKGEDQPIWRGCKGEGGPGPPRPQLSPLAAALLGTLGVPGCGHEPRGGLIAWRWWVGGPSPSLSALRAPQEPPQLPLGQLSPTTLLEPTPPTHAGQTHLWLCIWGAHPQHPQIRVTTPRDPAPTQQGRAQGSGPSTNTMHATNEPRGAALSPPAPNPFLPPTQPESV